MWTWEHETCLPSLASASACSGPTPTREFWGDSHYGEDRRLQFVMWTPRWCPSCWRIHFEVRKWHGWHQWHQWPRVRLLCELREVWRWARNSKCQCRPRFEPGGPCEQVLVVDLSGASRVGCKTKSRQWTTPLRSDGFQYSSMFMQVGMVLTCRDLICDDMWYFLSP